MEPEASWDTFISQKAKMAARGRVVIKKGKTKTNKDFYIAQEAGSAIVPGSATERKSALTQDLPKPRTGIFCPLESGTVGYTGTSMSITCVKYQIQVRKLFFHTQQT